MLIKPSKAAVKRFLDDIRELIKSIATGRTAELIRRLNIKLSGWANYYRHVVAKRTFAYVDTQVFRALWVWTKRRHPNKSAQWKKNRYFRHVGLQQWVFFAKVRDEFGRLGLPAWIYSKRKVYPLSGTLRSKPTQSHMIQPTPTISWPVRVVV